MTDYPGANRSQWFQTKYPGAHMTPNVVVLHTTEGGDWPSYSGGAVAPTLTVKANKATQKLDVRQHFPLESSARALENKPGGVDTNTANAIQIELVGSCANATGYGAIYWPDAPEWAYVELGRLLGQLHVLFPAIPLTSDVEWLAYGKDPRRPGVTPASYGASPARMSFDKWRRFTGICGHQHVPENAHGDPGNLPMDKILGYAKAAIAPSPARPSGKATVVLANVRDQFLIAAGVEKGKITRHGGVEVIQRQLNAQYKAGLKIDGLVGKSTLDAWGKHEAKVGVVGRPRVPDEHSLHALSRGGSIFNVQ